MHEAVLTGLKSGAGYTYCIRIGGVDVQGTFLTRPARDAPFTFAVWGDSQCFPKVFSGALRQMTKQTIDLALCTGDAVEVALTDGDYYSEPFKPA